MLTALRTASWYFFVFMTFAAFAFAAASSARSAMEAGPVLRACNTLANAATNCSAALSIASSAVGVSDAIIHFRVTQDNGTGGSLRVFPEIQMAFDRVRVQTPSFPAHRRRDIKVRTRARWCGERRHGRRGRGPEPHSPRSQSCAAAG